MDPSPQEGATKAKINKVPPTTKLPHRGANQQHEKAKTEQEKIFAKCRSAKGVPSTCIKKVQDFK